jgi:hypothetical protein
MKRIIVVTLAVLTLGGATGPASLAAAPHEVRDEEIMGDPGSGGGGGCGCGCACRP